MLHLKWLLFTFSKGYMWSWDRPVRRTTAEKETWSAKSWKEDSSSEAIQC